MSDFSFTAFNYRWAYTAQFSYEVEQKFCDDCLLLFVNAEMAAAHEVMLAAMKARR
jgi:hypothetical protein